MTEPRPGWRRRGRRTANRRDRSRERNADHREPKHAHECAARMAVARRGLGAASGYLESLLAPVDADRRAESAIRGTLDRHARVPKSLGRRWQRATRKRRGRLNDTPTLERTCSVIQFVAVRGELQPLVARARAWRAGRRQTFTVASGGDAARGAPDSLVPNSRANLRPRPLSHAVACAR
jgi:hypothetical protein